LFEDEWIFIRNRVPEAARILKGLEESAGGSAGADADLYPAAAFWAVTFVRRFALIDVNPYVDVTTGEMDAHETTFCRLSTGIRLRIAAKIEMFACHYF
jgi:hypothetical protein